MRRGVRRRVAVLAALLLVLAPGSSIAAPADARAAAVALAREAADLLAVHAFPPGGQTDALTAALQGLPLGGSASPAALRARLARDDAAGAAALHALLAAGARVSREVRDALAPLTAAQRAAVSRGQTISSPPSGAYLEALADLTARDGASPSVPGSPPQPEAVNAALASALPGGAPVVGGPTSGPAPSPTPAPRAASSPWPWVLAAAAGLAVVAGLAALARPRQKRRTPPVALTVPAGPQAHAGAQRVLEASRRLTTLTTDDDMSRAIVREAMSLVPAPAVALLVREAGQLVVGHESQAGMLRPEGFTKGVVDEAAGSGRQVAQMVAGDASFARLPAQVLLVPLVSSGRVDAVLVVSRDPMDLFTPAERELLATFAPVAAGAREAAARTQAAVDASQIDPLTGAGNRRQLDRHLEVVLRDAKGGPTGFFMIDLDHFKSVNDTHGHPAGDALLRQVCATIRSAVRPTDGVYRYGGEEFCVLLPATTLEETSDIAERVRAAIEAGSFDIGGGVSLRATGSVGVAATTGRDGSALVSRADQALYAAKAAGRNQVRSG